MIIEEILRTNANPLRFIHLIVISILLPCPFDSFFTFQTLDLYSTIKTNREILLHEESKDHLLALAANEKLALLIDDLNENELERFREEFEQVFRRPSTPIGTDSDRIGRDIPLISFLVGGDYQLIPSGSISNENKNHVDLVVCFSLSTRSK